MLSCCAHIITVIAFCVKPCLDLATYDYTACNNYFYIFTFHGRILIKLVLAKNCENPLQTTSGSKSGLVVVIGIESNVVWYPCSVAMFMLSVLTNITGTLARSIVF